MTASPERGLSASTARGLMAGVAVALCACVAALLATRAAGVPLRDPGGVTAERLAVALGVTAGVALVDALVRRGRRRWTARRALTAAAAIAAFYATYFGYRNLKSVVPLLRPDASSDASLAELDRRVAGGHDPAALLHDLLGTGAAAHVLSAVYMLFFAFIPVALAAALVLPADPRRGLFVVTALSLNWLLAAGSYFVLPSLGPFHELPHLFRDLPATPVSDLQARLVHERAAFLDDPGAPGATQSIGAFASLHVSIYVTAAIAAHLLRVGRAVQAIVWALTLLTVLATIYFGWHYLADDVAGAAIAVASLGLAWVLTRSELPALGRAPRLRPRAREVA